MDFFSYCNIRRWFFFDFSLTLSKQYKEKINVENATAFMTNQDKSTISTNNTLILSCTYITLSITFMLNV